MKRIKILGMLFAALCLLTACGAKQEQVVADFDRKIEAASADYQELTRLLGEKEEAEAALMDLMEQWEQVQT